MKYTILTLACITQLIAHAQVANYTTYTQAELLQNNFLANQLLPTNNSVSITNITLSGMDESIGLYDSLVNHPFEEGIAICGSGLYPIFEDSPIPFWLYDMPDSLFINPPYLDSLDNLIYAIPDQAFYNLTRIEIEVVPTLSSLELVYNYNSHEYQYSPFCTGLNDVFGIFIEGPGINGPYSNNALLASVIPNTQIPVHPNSIVPAFTDTLDSLYTADCYFIDTNFIDHSNYYINNNEYQFDTVPINFDIGGLTDSLRMQVQVTPLDTYKITIVTSEWKDQIYSSSLFLKKNSLESRPWTGVSLGCTDPNAINFNLNASQADTCVYPLAIHTNIQQPNCNENFGVLFIDSITGGTGIFDIDSSGLNFNQIPLGTHTIDVTNQYQTEPFAFNIAQTGTEVPTINANGVNLTSNLNTDIPLSYLWYLNNQPISGSNTQTYTISQNGYYQVETTYAGNCVEKSDSLYAGTFSIPESGLNTSFTNNILSIYDLETNFQIRIYNTLGQLQFASEQSTIDLSHLKSGIYHIEIHTQTYKTSLKVYVN